MQGQNINRNLKGNDCCVIKSQRSTGNHVWIWLLFHSGC